MTEYITINGRNIGAGHKPYVIAEVAQAHDGSLGMAHSYIDLASDVGADAVKFQVHMASEESTLDEPFRVKFSYEDDTRFDYWQRMEFSEEQWAGLARHAQDCGVDFLASAFSTPSVELLDRIEVPAWKIASGEITSKALLNRMAETSKPMLLSTGMSGWDEIDEAAAAFEDKGVHWGVFQCTTQYPTPLETVGLNIVDDLRSRYGVPTGLSDHSASIWPPVAALARGADMLEIHICFDRQVFGPDTKSSLTPAQFKEVVEARNSIYSMLGSPVDKDSLAQELAALKSMFSKSLAPAVDLPAGATIEEKHLKLKKPGTGISGEEASALVGRVLRRKVDHRRLFHPDDFEN